MQTTRRHFLRTATAAVCSLQFLKCSTTHKPNFIVILMDDMGWDDLGCQGNPWCETPSIDKLSSESVRFSQFYVNPVCAPTRASLLTGRNFLYTGVEHVHGGKDFVHLDETLVSEILQHNGYATGMWGKWHSGHADGYYPWDRGFDEAYMAQLYRHEDSRGKLNGTPVEHDTWADDVIVDYAIDFIEQHKSESFFAYLPFLSCHTPLAAPQKLIDKYTAKGLSKNLAKIYAMIEHTDIHLQRLFDYLQANNLDDNTIVFFLSDNGPAISRNLLTDADRDKRYVSKLKGHKGNIWENGVKSPLFVRWAHHFTPKDVHNLCDVTDLFPTLLNLAGIQFTPDYPLAGQSLTPLINGHPEKWQGKLSFNYANRGWPPTHEPYDPMGKLGEYQPIHPEDKPNLDWQEQIISVRDDRYKLMINPGKLDEQPELIDNFALFDILNDPREEKNLVREKPQVFERLKKELQVWYESVVSSKHSYNMPVFQIGYSDSMDVFAKAPVRVSANLKNTTNALWHWYEGDWAEYRITIVDDTGYEISLHHDSEHISNALIQVTIGDNKLSTRITDAQDVPLGVVQQPPGEYTLKVKVKESRGLAMDKLLAIRLRKLE